MAEIEEELKDDGETIHGRSINMYIENQRKAKNKVVKDEEPILI